MKFLQAAFILLLGLAVARAVNAVEVQVVDTGLFFQVASGDFNDDGKSDVAVASMNDKLLKLFYGGGSGNSFSLLTMSARTGSVKNLMEYPSPT